jgi:T5SS/PEP-CTERM-associated repeat protein
VALALVGLLFLVNLPTRGDPPFDISPAYFGDPGTNSGALGEFSPPPVICSVHGAGAIWEPYDSRGPGYDMVIWIGHQESGTTLTITDSGKVVTTNGLNLGNGFSSSINNTLQITSGGELDVGASADVGYGVSPSNSVLVSQGLWSIGRGLDLEGPYSSLTISNGGKVTALSAFLGSGVNNQSAVQVTGGQTSGPPSTLRITNDLIVGSASNVLTIAAGAVAEDGNFYIGLSGGLHNIAVVTDTNSVWTHHTNVYCYDNWLSISNGAKVLDDYAYLNGSLGNGGPGATAWVTDPGSVWTNAHDLYVGGSPPHDAANRMIISNGASVFSVNGYLGFNVEPLAGNRVVVTDPKSMWTNGVALYVGYAGASNELVTTNGGVVADTDGYVGYTNAGFYGPAGPFLQFGKGQANRVLVTGAGSTWTNSGSVFIGYQAYSNQVVITNGGLLRSSNSTLGFGLLSSNNVAIVTGSNVLAAAASHWISLADLVIGNAGSGNQLAVSAAALVESRNGTLGSMSSSTNNGALIADSLTAWNVKSNLYVGNAGAGNQLVVSNNAQVLVTSNVTVGAMNSSSNNLVFVTDPSSFLENQGLYMSLGYGGANNWLVISNQGEVKVGLGSQQGSSHLSIGDQTSSSNNAVLVTGPNSLLGPGHQVDDFQIHVGNQGAGNLLIATNYGLVISTKGFIGDASSATANVAIVTDQGQWRIQPTGSGTDKQTFYVGNNGAQNQLLVTNAGVVTVTNTGATIGFAIISSNNTATVTGPGSLWTIQYDLHIGESGASNQLVVINNGTVQDANGIVGDLLTSSNNLVRVTGVSSLWTNTSDVTIGQTGAGNRLVVSAGGDVESANGSIGSGISASNNSALVMNGPSRWNLQTNLYVGDAGSFNNLAIGNSAVINDLNGYVGNAASAQGNQAMVTDLGSSWIHTSTMYVGSSGSSNVLMITNSASVKDYAGDIGLNPGANGNSVRVTDLGSTWANTSTLIVGDKGSGNQLTVVNGGLADCSALILGANAVDSSNNVVVVTGPQSLIKSPLVTVGNFGTSNQLVVADNGKVKTDATDVGASGVGMSVSSLNQLTVTGTGALYDNSGNFDVGNIGVQNSLLIAAGGELRDNLANLGLAAGSSSNLALVTDAGSLWRTTNDLNVGFSGSWNQLTVAGGGLVTSSNGILGFNSSSAANIVVITDPGSVWDMTTNLYVGNSGAGCQLMIENGGTVNDTFGDIGYLSGANGNSVTVAGTGSGWNNSSNVCVGSGGSQNQLTISGGGQVGSVDGFLGYSVASSGNSVVVTGAGSRWTLSDGLYVGYGGTNNQFTISGGGLVSVPHSAFIGFASSGNTLTLAGGTLNVVDPTTHKSVLNVLRGGFLLLNGVLVTDQLLLTNGANCIFNFEGGEVDTRQTTVSNTFAFTVGNGTNTATLNLLGGLHSFANGVLISSNAFLTGTGTNAGNVSCAGTVSPGGSNSIASLFITGNYTQSVSGAFNVAIGGLAAGTLFDQLNVTGTAALAGTLNVTFTNGFNPQPGEAFRILTYGSHSGTFSTANGLRASNGLLLTAQYNSTNLTLIAANVLSLQSVHLTGTNFTFDISTVTGSTYVVEYTDSLSPPAWHTLQTVVGDGTLHTITDAITASTQRFYRVRVQ